MTRSAAAVASKEALALTAFAAVAQLFLLSATHSRSSLERSRGTGFRCKRYFVKSKVHYSKLATKKSLGQETGFVISDTSS